MKHNELQRTRGWYLARKGHITSSQVVCLLTKPRDKSQLFSDTALSYLNGVLAERFLDDDIFIGMKSDEKPTQAMEYGSDWESTAISEYEKVTDNDVEDMPFCELNEYAGGSPDGKVDDGIIEVKCPFNIAHHFVNMQLTDQMQLLNGTSQQKQYYAQMQMNMLVTGTDWCDYISFCPAFMSTTRPLAIKVLRVERDNLFIETLQQRLSEAVAYLKAQEAKINEQIFNSL